MPEESRKTYFVEEPQFETWLGKRLLDGVYDGNEGKLTEWYNGVFWNTRIRISGGPLVTDDLLAEGTSKDRAEARKQAEDQAIEKLGRLTNNAKALWINERPNA